MRIRALALITAFALGPAAGASAQDAAPGTVVQPSGRIDFGARFTDVDGDEARFQRYRDLRGGGLFDALRVTQERGNWLFNVSADHVGYRDQRYAAEVVNYARGRLTFTWDQTPLFFSTGDVDRFGLLSATAYQRVAPGEYRLDDSMQQALQAVCPQPPCGAATAQRQALLYRLVNEQAQTLDVRHRRDTARLDGVYTITPRTDVKFRVVSVNRTGTQPWGASFGFSNPIELPGPVEQRSTDIGAAVEWANSRTLLTMGWDGSWFNNRVTSLVWDNPLRQTDFTYANAYSAGDGSSQGRMALWPDSSTNTFSGTATHRITRTSRVYANLALSRWTQNEELLPFTINTAIPVIPLPRQTADAGAFVTSALVGYSARPTNRSWLNVRYKLYDFDNQTEFFPVQTYVRLDGNAYPFAGFGTGNHIFEYRRQYFDADTSYTILPFTAVRLGYSMEHDNREFREFERTTDNMVKVALDTTGWRYGTFRLQYDYARRTGEGLDQEVFDAEQEGFASARQFDISDRNRNRVSFLTTLVPHDLFTISAQVGIFRDERPHSPFGLLESRGDFYSIGIDVAPVEQVAFGATWGRDKYSSLQRSRQANPGPQQADVRRDWTADVEDTVDSLFLSVDLLRVLPRTDIRYGFDLMDGVNDLTYGLRPDQTIFVPPAQLLQVPNASHRISRSMLEVMYQLGRRFGVGFGWLYEDYAVDDWAWSQETVNGLSLNPPGQPGGQQIVPLRNLYRPYTGNSGFVRLRYFW
jgi:MtrB/PioB family decaheme-associated outer membrane protein